MPWIFLAVTVVGALFTFNVYLPRPPHGVLSVPSFFAGWLTSELVVHHFAWQLAATVLFVGAGALRAWPGWLGLGITGVSWVAMLALVPVARRSQGVVDEALGEIVGTDGCESRTGAANTGPEARRPRGRLALPFLLRDPAVRRVADRVYAPGAGRRHRLDVYLPRAGVRGAPILLQVHGGGWVIGDKREQALPLMLQLAARGWVCVAANYRLSPRATFPEHLIDLKLAIRWIREHAAEYGGDPDFLAVTGGSAGGHLAALVALSAGDPAYQPGFEGVDTSVQACVPFYGVYDFTDRFGHNTGMTGFLERLVMKKRLADDPEAFERASPLSRIRPGAPPFFVIHGSHDSLVPVDEARRFVQELRATSRAPVAYAELPYAQHAFEVFHSLRTRHVVDGVERFLNCVHARWSAERERVGAQPLSSGGASGRG